MTEGTLNKAELIKRVATATGQKRALVTEIIDSALQEIEGAVANHEKIAIAGYLKAHAKYVPARTRRNPQDGSPVEVPAGFKLVFKAGSKLEAAV